MVVVVDGMAGQWVRGGQSVRVVDGEDSNSIERKSNNVDRYCVREKLALVVCTSSPLVHNNSNSSVLQLELMYGRFYYN